MEAQTAEEDGERGQERESCGYRMEYEKDRDAFEYNVDFLALPEYELEELGVDGVSELRALAVAVVREYTCWHDGTESRLSA